MHHGSQETSAPLSCPFCSGTDISVDAGGTCIFYLPCALLCGWALMGTQAGRSCGGWRVGGLNLEPQAHELCSKTGATALRLGPQQG